MRHQEGVTLIEVVISIAVLGVVAAGIFGYFAWSFGVFNHTNTRATGESLARSQVEYIKTQSWNGTGTYRLLPDSSIPMGYTISGGDTAEVPVVQSGQKWLTFATPVAGVQGLQQITVIVERTYSPEPAVSSTENVTLHDYKGNR